MFPVDAVICWVDGNDPVLNTKRALYGDQRAFSRDDLAGSTRFANNGEIAWCVKSINRFAPFIRKIFIITDGQDPKLESDIPIEIVDHTVVFRGYEDFLPVFNSLSIETMMWRIPGLSEHFIYFNDDFLLASDVSVSDFFEKDGTPVCYASLHLSCITSLTRKLKRSPDGVRKATFKGFMLNAASLAGSKVVYLKLDHIPRAHTVSFHEQFFAAHPDAIARNIRHRFRDADQYLPDLLEYSAGFQDGSIRPRPIGDTLFYLMPKPKPGYVAKKLSRLRKGNCKFCCFNSLDGGTEEDRRMVEEWIEANI